MKFYRGRKRLAKKALTSRQGVVWRYFCKHGTPKIGDITHDCDGENHVITAMDIRWRHWGNSAVVDIDCYWTNEQGHKTLVCSCGGMGFQPPESPDYVKSFLVSWTSPEEMQRSEDWQMEVHQRGKDVVTGKAFIDSRGVVVYKE